MHGSSCHIHTLFMHKCCWMTHSQGLKGCRDTTEMCIYVAAGLDPVSPWRDGSMHTFLCPGLWLMLVLWAARPCCSTWSCWVRCFQDLSGTWWDEGPGGGLSRDNSPSVAEGGCWWPAWFSGQRLPPHGYGHTSPGSFFGFILDFGKDALNLWYRKQRKERKFLTPFSLYLFL